MLKTSRLSPFAVRYTEDAGDPQPSSETLALFGFGDTNLPRDPRALRVPLEGIGPMPSERWLVETQVKCGREGALQWSAGGGWLFVALDLHEHEHGGIEAAAEHAYRLCCGFIAAREEHHLLRVWNYLHAINEGAGDAERYRRFCVGRARGLGAHGIERYPAATAIGHRGRPGLLQVYVLCAIEPGSPVENPRQVSAWRYPREYGPTPPSFARAMKLPGGGLAISGTAAVVGHASRHQRDVVGQVAETCANLRALLDASGAGDFDANSPLKVYLRRADDAAPVSAALSNHLRADVPRMFLLGDVCRSELLVEIDGWRLSPAT